VIEPLLGDGEIVFILDQLRRGIIEGPHPFFGVKKSGKGQRD
jgi:hypothetical protein